MTDRSNDSTRDVDSRRRRVTPEVGDEGGSFGNVEIAVDQGAGTGSEATELWRPTKSGRDVTVRDETGQGRRNP